MCKQHIDFNVLLNINFDNNVDLTLVIHCNGIRRSHAKRDELYLVAAIHVGPPDCSNTVNPEHIPAEYMERLAFIFLKMHFIRNT